MKLLVIALGNMGAGVWGLGFGWLSVEGLPRKKLDFEVRGSGFGGSGLEIHDFLCNPKPSIS